MVCGITSTWSSPVLVKLEDENYLNENPFGALLTSDEESWIGSLMSLGAMLGPIPWALISDKIGRKPTLLLLSIPLFVSFIVLAFAKVLLLYYIARFMAGLAMGGSFTVIPMYIAEIAEVSNRGVLTALFNGLLVLGMFVSYAVGPYVHLVTFNLICASSALVFFMLFLVFCPESPTYLVAANRPEEAKRALTRVRITGTVKEIESELQEIKREAENNAQGSIRDFWRNRGLLKTLLMVMVLVGFQPLSGCDVVQFYTQTIFEETGTDIPSDIAAIIVGAVQMVFGLVAPFFADHVGRKPMLLLSSLVMVLAEVPLGIYFYLNHIGHDTTKIQWLPILCLILYVIAFNFGFGPLAWTVMGEVFPSHVKTVACGITASFVWLCSFTTTRFFFSIADGIGTGGAFWLFAAFSLLAGIFVLVVVPETKGKTFLEIQKKLKM